jgi:hypothetical protein
MKTLIVKITIISVLILGYFNVVPQNQVLKQNTMLIKHIDSMFKDDQFWRKEFGKTQRKEKSVYSDETIQKRWAEADSINELKAKAIIKKYGFPGYNLVGETSNKFWAIVQHCDDDIPFQEHVLILLKKEVDKNNASKANYALLTDRVLANKHQPQIYGTQVNVDPKTHKAAPLPLKHPKEVNKLRKQMGMEPLEKYLKSFE